MTKFLIVNQEFDAYHWLIVVDFGFFNKEEENITAWIEDCNIHMTRQGIILKFQHQEELTQFLLKWS